MPRKPKPEAAPPVYEYRLIHGDTRPEASVRALAVYEAQGFERCKADDCPLNVLSRWPQEGDMYLRREVPS